MRKSCMYIESGIVFLTDSIRFCCLAGTQSVIAPLNSPEMDIDHFLSFRESVSINPLESCLRCALLRPMPTQSYDRNRKLTHINLAHGDICNFKCDYCYTSRPGFTCSPPKYKITPILRQLCERGLIADGCTFSYASGEPVFNPEFSEFLRFSEELRGYNFITSNCSIYNGDLARVLDDGRGEVLCSVDAGTKEIFLKVRGSDSFDTVLKNLEAYAAKGKTVSKYIVYEPNCHPHEMVQYIRLMRGIGIRHIHLALDAYSDIKTEYIYTLALGKYLALCLDMDVFEADHLSRSKVIKLAALTNAVIAEQQDNFFNILQNEFPNAEYLTPLSLGNPPFTGCDGHIDAYPQGKPNCAMFRVEGWIADTETGTVFPSVFVKIGSLYFKANSVSRPDVAKAYTKPSLICSGFSALILSRFLAAGVHHAETIGVSGGKYYAAGHRVIINI